MYNFLRGHPVLCMEQHQRSFTQWSVYLQVSSTQSQTATDTLMTLFIIVVTMLTAAIRRQSRWVARLWWWKNPRASQHPRQSLQQPLCTNNSIQMTITSQQQQPFNSRLSGTTRVGRYQKKQSPAHTHPGQRTSFITFLHLQWSTASSLFSLRAWQSLSLIHIWRCRRRG